MSDSNDKQAPAAMQAMLLAGQTMAQTFFDMVAKQHAAMQDSSGVAAPQLPLPESDALKRMQEEFAAKHVALWSSLLGNKPGEPREPVAQPEPGDRRFNAPEWTESPIFDYVRQAYLVNSGFLKQVADEMPISDGRAKSRIQFLTRQYIDALAPSNFAATNPEFIKAAVESKGESITQGIRNLIEDLEKGRISMTDDGAFEVGRNLAVSPGAVVF
jgi:polyhydroxyalkanoate synthase